MAILEAILTIPGAEIMDIIPTRHIQATAYMCLLAYTIVMAGQQFIIPQLNKIKYAI